MKTSLMIRSRTTQDAGSSHTRFLERLQYDIHTVRGIIIIIFNTSYTDSKTVSTFRIHRVFPFSPGFREL